MPQKTARIELPDVTMEQHHLYLVGTAPLIVHAFPEKARRQMLDKQMKLSRGGREARDPYAEVEACRYRLPDGRDGFPAVGFKSAAVTACTSLGDVTKIAARQAFRVIGLPMNAPGTLDGSLVRTALVPLFAPEPTIREDVVRLAGPSRSAEMRYRPEYPAWGVVLQLVLNPRVISISQAATMFQAAGHGVGVGDYRPERDGDAGTFEVVSRAEFEEWRKEAGL
ncbi:hypothetical protein [Fodinicurvata sediminis]|uniref:hypothetical protein n=1 Tax=Fodinicurvata sediminis TaxID=1121832 RepID=UPI0003B40CEF|nr:hypothetical protein [Fodinicurvata sediminis]